MEIVINGKSHEVQSGEILDDKIVCVTLKFIDDVYNDVAYYTARYSDPYCGNRAKAILDAINTEPYSTQIKNYLNSL